MCAGFLGAAAVQPVAEIGAHTCDLRILLVTNRALHYPSPMGCQMCERGLSDVEAIYRLGLGYSHAWWRTISGSIAYICRACLDAQNDLISRALSAPKSCTGCGRPVIGVGRRRLPKQVTCGPRCKAKGRSRAGQGATQNAQSDETVPDL
jgi:hypothetical protein